MSIVEGSRIFTCTNTSHEAKFETTDLKEFNEHLMEQGHTYYGRAPCAVCGIKVSFKDSQVGKKPVCDSCKAELIV
jgi:predicted Zn-ribbon and HTH transcriptional regulator